MAQPSLSAFLARFPEFGCVDHALIVSVLAEAPLYVDARWEEMEELGAMLYTAHCLAMQGQGDGPASKIQKTASVISLTSGSHKVQYKDASGTGLGFAATPYGQQFESVRGRMGVSMVSVL